MTGDDIKNIGKKHPIGVACGALAIVCAVVLYFTSDTLDEKKGVYEDTAKKEKAITTNVTNFASLPEQTEAVQHAVKDIEGRLIHASQLAINLQYFYRLESETGVKMTEVHQGNTTAPRPGSGKAAYTATSFAVNIQGTYKQVLDFIHRVENGQRIARFSSVSFTKASGENVAPDAFSVSMGIDFLSTP